MARLPRLYIKGCPQHIIQRGNNRSPIFFDNEDYAFYLQNFEEASEKYKVEIHAFILMSNHVHILATPSSETSISRMIQSIGRRYVGFINTKYGRSGTLWEGRYKSCLVDSDKYFFQVSRYIELNPVRAKMVKKPDEYRWSSYRGNAMGKDIALLTPHFLYQQLGRTQAQRIIAYRSLFEEPLEKETIREINTNIEKELVFGSDKFIAIAEVKNERKINKMSWGGDRKSTRFKSEINRSE